MRRLLPLLATFALCAAAAACSRAPAPNSPSEQRPAENRYVDASLCAECHASIAETYSRTGMGRSFSRASAANTLGAQQRAASYFHKPSGSYFTISEREGRFYQRRHQIGFDGRETNVLDKPIDFVIGSGNHARTYLSLTARNTLLELPLGWYAERQGTWAMNPGYDRPDHPGFARAITYGCMFCHNGLPRIPAANQRSGVEPVFELPLPEGIDCQRCHGPGGLHVDSGGMAPITNPARLSSERQIEVCMQCHLETTSARLPNALVRFERGPFSYRPGEPLADFVLHFDHAPGSGHDDKFEIAGAAYRLRQSACFMQSAGKMTCTTCHNPHDVPRGGEAQAKYTAACRQCHSGPEAHTQSGDCIACHMPKRPAEDAVHVVMTDHYIQRQKPARNLVASIPERSAAEESGYRGPVILYYPQDMPAGADRDLYLAVAQVSHGSNVGQGIPDLAAAVEKHRPEKMEFYLQLADAWRDSGNLGNALPLYQEAVKREPESPIALQRLGFALRSAGRAAEAADVLERAVAVDPRDAASRHQLGLVYLDRGLRADALAAFQQAVEADPDLFEAHNSLGGFWLEAGELLKAEAELRQAINLRPVYAEAHSNLAGVLASTNRFPEAIAHFEAALKYNPNFAAGRLNYGIALAKMNRIAEARRQIELALKLNPDFAEARNALRVLEAR